MVVFNPAPFESADYVVLPRDCQLAGLPAQAIEDGVVVYCAGVPPNGYAALPLGDAGAPDVAMTVSAERIDTPFWSIDLDGG